MSMCFCVSVLVNGYQIMFEAYSIFVSAHVKEALFYFILFFE